MTGNEGLQGLGLAGEQSGGLSRRGIEVDFRVLQT